MNDKPVTVIVTGRNSETTIRACLESLATQDYPIDDILFFDNGSTDDTRKIAEDVAAHAAVSIRVIDGGARGFICSAYNRGVAMARSEVVVLCHSDGMIPFPGELRKLVTPLFADPAAAAAYPRLLMPREIWNRFPFWQKFQFVRAVDCSDHSRCAIFDAVRKSVYERAGGFNERRFYAGCGYGGEDNDAQWRFGKLGRQLLTEARAVHLHGFSPGYRFANYLRFRALLARTYGMQLRWQRGVANASDLYFFVRPALAALPFAAAAFFAFGMWPGLCALAVAFALQFAFAVLNGRRMFVSRVTLADPRILLVIPVAMFMTYFETVVFFRGLCWTPEREPPARS